MTSTRKGLAESWNLSRVCGFYCFEAIDTLFIFVDGRGRGIKKLVIFCRCHQWMTPFIEIELLVSIQFCVYLSELCKELYQVLQIVEAISWVLSHRPAFTNPVPSCTFPVKRPWEWILWNMFANNFKNKNC